MLLSLRELIVWTGLGPFEVSIHSFALFVFTLLTILRVEGVFSPSWHIIFIPLYVALGITVCYDLILYIRMAVYGWQRVRRFLLFVTAANAVGLAVLLFVEFSIADFLDGRTDSVTVVFSLCTVLGYLVFRIPFAFRALRVAT